MKTQQIKFWLLMVVVIAAYNISAAHQKTTPDSPETKALSFLRRDVPAWKPNNGCFSCHNNGDAARALYAALRQGYAIPNDVLAETNAWLSHPARWEQNQGDPGFSDKKLANLQFAAALLAGIEVGQIKEQESLRQAAHKVIGDQSSDGSWPIDVAGTIGSPTTWGTPLATWMAVQILRKANFPEAQSAAQKAERWLQQVKSNNVLNAATLVQALHGFTDKEARRKQMEALQFLRRAQTRDGGWGPFADAPAECFDTAFVLLSLIPMREQSEVKEMIRRGREFLIAEQNTDGSWAATTRPSGGDSYAQMMSTTGWATMALLETKP